MGYLLEIALDNRFGLWYCLLRDINITQIKEILTMTKQNDVEAEDCGCKCADCRPELYTDETPNWLPDSSDFDAPVDVDVLFDEVFGEQDEYPIAVKFKEEEIRLINRALHFYGQEIASRALDVIVSQENDFYALPFLHQNAINNAIEQSINDSESALDIYTFFKDKLGISE
jgi:hypothetical protein